MTFSTLVATDPDSVERTVIFRADERYSLGWQLIDNEESALPNAGKSIFLSAGQSITEINVSGSLLTVDGGDSADRQLFNDLHLLAKRTMGLRDGSSNYLKATLTLILNASPASQVIMSGWMTDFIADRDAVEGLVEVVLSFRFLMEDDPIITGLV